MFSWTITIIKLKEPFQHGLKHDDKDLGFSFPHCKCLFFISKLCDLFAKYVNSDGNRISLTRFVTILNIPQKFKM
jgi:hypothetical protein